MNITGQFENQQEAQQHDGGIDHGSRGIVLVDWSKKYDLRLVWRKGGKHWSSRGEQSYHPAQLEVLGGKDERGHWKSPRTIFEGGRLTFKRIENHLDQIRVAIELPSLSMKQVHLKKTFVVTETR